MGLAWSVSRSWKKVSVSNGSMWGVNVGLASSFLTMLEHKGIWEYRWYVEKQYGSWFEPLRDVG